MKRLIFLFLFVASCTWGQQPNRPQLVAGFPVNYDEDKVGEYTLPDLFLSAQGKRVTDAKAWTKTRRPEIVKLFEEFQYGKMPGRPASMTFDVFDKGTPVFNGKAIRKQVAVQFSKDWPDNKMYLVIYLPAGAKKRRRSC